MKKIINLILLILLIIVIKKLFTRNIYIGFFYPDAQNLTDWKRSGELKSLEECRDWVYSQVSYYKDNSWDYECGKNCKYKSEFDIYYCEETLE